MTTTSHHTESGDVATFLIAGEGIEPEFTSVGFSNVHRQLSKLDDASSFDELVRGLAPVFATTSARHVALCQCDQGPES